MALGFFAARPSNAQTASTASPPSGKSPTNAPAPTTSAADSTGDATPRIQVGAGSGSLSLGDGRTASGVISLLTVRASRWAAISVAPTLERLNSTLVTSTSGVTRAIGPAASGFADLPVSVVTQHQFDDAVWQPSLVASVSGLLPTGDAARGLGAGRGEATASVGASVQPVDPVEVNVSTMRDITYSGAPTALQADINTQLGERGGVDLGWSRDVMGLAGNPAYASVSVGTSWQIGHGLVVGADWSRSTVGAGASRLVLQGVSVGIGMVVPSFVPSNGDPAVARGHSGASGRQRAVRGKAKGKSKTKAKTSG
jgi:hypothetical protein